MIISLWGRSLLYLLFSAFATISGVGKPRLLLTGASGFIGGRLRRELVRDWDIIGTRSTRAEPGLLPLDLTDPGQIERVFAGAAPEAVVHAAAMADPDACERAPDLAFRVNRDATALLAGLCARAGARLVFFSTDLVFDGGQPMSTEDAPPRPICVYGRTKLEAEAAALDAGGSAAVLRVATVYGHSFGSRKSFLDALLAVLSRGERARVFSDQWRTATSCAQLPRVISALLGRGEISGVFHWTGATRASRWEFAREACRVFGFPEDLLEPASMDQARLPAPRPRDTSLDSTRLSGLLGIELLSLRGGLELARREYP
ncbi:MAG: SDR family oxidoreductase [Elusimicrobia bacterium]|nr:SDR family oxidoreductase [Elusimicrobiota bacterium]